MSKSHKFKFPSSNTGAGGRGIKITFILSPTLKKSKLIRVVEFESCTKSYWRHSFVFQHIFCWDPFNNFLLRNSWIWKLAESSAFHKPDNLLFYCNSRIFLYAISVTVLANSSANEGLLWITLVQSLTTWPGNPLSIVWAKNVSHCSIWGPIFRNKTEAQAKNFTQVCCKIHLSSL